MTDLIPILQVLYRKRLLVAASFVVAVAIAVSMIYRVSFSPPGLHSRQYQVGVAAQNVLIDTPKSTIADVTPATTDMMSRTILLANLMVTPKVETSIASELGISTDQLVVTNSSTSGLPVISTQLATTAASMVPPSKGYALSIATFGGLPILAFSAQAPNPERAAALAGAASNALEQYIHTVAASQQIPANQLTVITPLGSPVFGPALRGPKKLYAVAAALLSFVLLCTLIVVVTGIRRGLRVADEFMPALASPEPMDVNGGNGTQVHEPQVALRSTSFTPSSSQTTSSRPQPTPSTQPRQAMPATNPLPTPASKAMDHLARALRRSSVSGAE